MAATISKKRKVSWPSATCTAMPCVPVNAHRRTSTPPPLDVQFVADGVFYAELNELLTRELAEHGYSGVEVRVTPMRTEIIIKATRTQNVLGELQAPSRSSSPPPSPPYHRRENPEYWRCAGHWHALAT